MKKRDFDINDRYETGADVNNTDVDYNKADFYSMDNTDETNNANNVKHTGGVNSTDSTYNNGINNKNTDNIDLFENVEETDKQEEQKKTTNWVKEIFSWIRIFLVALVIAFLINNFVIINANVPSGSMEKTIMTDDRMIGLRTSYWFKEPQRGDIVIFKNPDNQNETFVKRLIGLPGEKVVIKDAKIYINDSEEPLKEDYLPEEWTRSNGSDNPMEYNVPEDGYFMLGDNRNLSRDARFWNNTYVTKDLIIAQAKFVYWPLEHKSMLESAEY